ncbi:RagB/SusD domain-containing protein (plasmid) [Gemmatirosa kalamazoonensis]|uniref:RagB/SusD domain-containing protein n=1 Tax=Gemmatirosa kalamazoonensis TaxID=861299 RepID=W0RU41_9BACT|nr:RagB/SusD family nutrient uptake outer membrane protein [Gemmatirosa kalamazoonensis]AHG93830.1 RagB/SusD domain-containing protein [Gemmatirosa kalamazoonensis]
MTSRLRLLLACAAALPIALAGCKPDKLLDVVSPTTVSDDIFWSQENDAVIFLNGTYSALPSWITVIELDGLTDDGTTNRQFDDRYVYSDGSFDPQKPYSRNHWNNFYNGVARANALIANIDRIPAGRIDPARKARYVAEAKFLRGVFYLQLVSMFGDVPMPLTPLTDAEARKMTNTPAAKIYDQVLADLDAAAAVLPTTYTGADVGRATKGAALAFKARAALYAGRYQIAADAAKAVMDLGIYRLNADYGQLFLYAGENSPEIIFAHKYSKTAQAAGQNNNIFGEFGPPSNSASAHMVPIRNLVDSYQMTDGKSIKDSPLYNPAPDKMYLNRDPRLAATILFPGASWDGRTFDSRPKPLSTQPEAIDLQNENTSVTGYYIRKWIDLTDKTDRGNGGIDVSLMRYADVLLMYAEAKLEAGQPDASALAALNQVRARVSMPPVAALTRDAVRYERRAELAFEGLRLFDIRRWKIAEQVMPTPVVTGIDYIDASGQLRTATVPASARAFPQRDYLWPIPQAELDLNQNLKQNPGF